MKNYFTKEIIPENDGERLKALSRYEMIERLPQGYFAKLSRIIATTFHTPIALISLVHKYDVQFIGNYGMEDTERVSRGISLCSLAILDDHPTVFDDATKEPCLLANPLVIGEFGLRFYAGAPIITHDGFAIGTACIVDKEPRTLSEAEQKVLQDFATMAMQEIELRYKNLGPEHP